MWFRIFPLYRSRHFLYSMHNMKYVFVLSFLFFFSGCTSSSPDLREERMISISDSRGNPIGKGVLVQSDKIMTATHIYHDCQKTNCRYSLSSWSLSILEDILPEIQGDRILLSVVSSLPSPYLLEYEEAIPMSPVYALVSRSWLWSRLDGKILAIDKKYFAYDSILSGAVFTWGIETDIVLEKGESGTPIWSLSGWLIWVMSAIDREGKRSWIVR